MTEPAASLVFESAPTHTEQRRKVIVVGGTKVSDRLISLIHSAGMQAKLVPSYLSALGEVSAEPAAIVVGPVDVLHGSMKSIVNGLRTLAPQTRIVALCNQAGADQRHNAAAAGFDDCLVEPIGPQTLVQLLGTEKPERAGQAFLQERHKRESTAVIPDSQPESQAESAEQQELGDIDLVESLLTGRGDLESLAIRLIASTSGIQGVGLRPADGASPDGHTSVNVVFKGKRLGLLHAPPPATADALHPWADWLSRWLALGTQITELNCLALRDELTGIWNRRYFNRFLERILKKAAADRSQVTLLMFDIDDFKLYNDKHGHATGDDVLRETARLMRAVVRDHDVVARIGGDEFAVIFWDNEKPRKPNSEHPQDVVAAARRFQDAICSHRFPKLMDKAVGRLTVSGGLASFPWDGRTPCELLARADAMAMQSKKQGKNAITFGTGSKRACPEG